MASMATVRHTDGGRAGVETAARLVECEDDPHPASDSSTPATANSTPTPANAAEVHVPFG
jgi:hypothetical protein